MEKPYNVRYTLSAQEDLKNITDYIGNTLQNEKATFDFILELEQTVKILQKFPFSAAPSKNITLAKQNVRFTTVNNYVVHFLPDEKRETIFILYIKHGLEDNTKIIPHI